MPDPSRSACSCEESSRVGSESSGRVAMWISPIAHPGAGRDLLIIASPGTRSTAAGGARRRPQRRAGYKGRTGWGPSGLVILVLFVVLVALIGALLPKGHVAARSAVYRRPPEDVWAAIHGFAAYPEWRKDAAKVEILPPVDGHERFRETNRFGVITFSV